MIAKLPLLHIAHHPVPSTSTPKLHLSLLHCPPNDKTNTQRLQNSTRRTRVNYSVYTPWIHKQSTTNTKKMKPCQPELSMKTHGRRTKRQATNEHITRNRETAKPQPSKRKLPWPILIKTHKPKDTRDHYNKTCLRHLPSLCVLKAEAIKTHLEKS